MFTLNGKIAIMDTRDYTIRAFDHLAQKKGCSQKAVAEAIGENAKQLNEFLRKKRNFSEAKREKIASYFGLEYTKMLLIGKELVTGKKSLQSSQLDDMRTVFREVIREEISLKSQADFVNLSDGKEFANLLSQLEGLSSKQYYETFGRVKELVRQLSQPIEDGHSSKDQGSKIA